MFHRGGIEPIDYLVIGHISIDIDPEGAQLGGPAAYSALMANVLGQRVGLVTSIREDTNLDSLSEIAISNTNPSNSTSFENLHHHDEKVRQLISRADNVEYYHVPELWRRAPIVHLAPCAQEIPISMARKFEGAFLGMTPKGWLREWDARGRMSIQPWPEADFTLRFGDAVVVNDEDIQGSEELTTEMARAAKVLVIRRGLEGASVYMMGEEHFISAPVVDEVDAAGADDIFAATFFCSLHGTGDALGAARFANQMAALSASRRGLGSVPSKDEIFDFAFEVH